MQSTKDASDGTRSCGPGRQPTVPSTLIAGIEYSLRMFSSQSAQRVSTERLGSRMRWRVVTPPTRVG